MKIIFKIALALLLACPALAQQKALTVSSSAFKANGLIPAKYTCEGANINPPLTISAVPAGTKSFALTIHDPDALKPGGVTHWVIWNLPPNGKVAENFKGGIQGLNSDNQHSYKGMCPPNGSHHYNFRIYALDTKLRLPANTDRAGLEEAVKGHVLAEGMLTGVYHKTK